MVENCQLPPEILLKVFEFVDDPKSFGQSARVCRKWNNFMRQERFWRKTEFVNKSRLSLRHLKHFVNSPYANYVEELRIEGFTVRRSDQKTTSTLTNDLFTQMDRKMRKLRKLSLWNANISNVNIQFFPKSLKHLSLRGCIIARELFVDMDKPEVLPILSHLDLNYVHNFYGHSQAFQSFLIKTQTLTGLELRHCRHITNSYLIKLSTFCINMRLLNLSEIAALDDTVLAALCTLPCLTELYVSHTCVTDDGISSLCQLKSLKILDIRGCPRVTSSSLYRLESDSLLSEVHISREMSGAPEAREALADSRLSIKDEVDLKLFRIALPLSINSPHFADVVS